MPDEIGSNTWTVGVAFDASTQPGVYGTDDCAGTYQSNSTAGEMTFDQTIPAQWFGVVVTGTAGPVFAVSNGTEDVTHSVTGTSVLVTWKITDSGISVYEDSFLAATYPAATYSNLRLQVHGAGFAHGFITDDAGVVEMRLAHQRNFLAYNTGQAPTYCQNSPTNDGPTDPDDDGYLCVSPCYK